MNTTTRSRSLPVAVWVLTILAALFFLRTAYELLIPIVIAVLLSCALEVTRSPELIERGAGWILSGAGHATVIVFLLFFLLAHHV